MASSKTFSGSPPDPLSGEEASEILGSISMAAFLCLLLPQLYANYKLQSADSLSMAFLFIWLVGDISNLLGMTQVSVQRASKRLLLNFGLI
ncbi:vacuolar membrane PQ loop repeat protein [Colletotrichum karsti]|uniref:Vacuolar membrane PQ loop repeat protein n=1 Tax=Colletotrichum karsti TaxID=1095194 RepID=A0A9P6I247_9PEZI|nr:vacuolar membrane PQ loop repeat protein [Colletotrichum karsti]KAF9874372.1 vacuolar membrane PQ loop repeat protein [Colletotrichum karsti]